MMKLEELGISRGIDKNRPWCATENGEFVCAQSTSDAVARIFGKSRSQIVANACLIEAAPKMYKALYNALPLLKYIGAKVVGNDSADEIAVVVNDIKNALAEASGYRS